MKNSEYYYDSIDYFVVSKNQGLERVKEGLKQREITADEIINIESDDKNVCIWFKTGLTKRNTIS